MKRYIFTFFLFFMVQNCLFSQTKSTNYSPKKAVVAPKKTNANPAQKPKPKVIITAKPKIIGNTPSDTTKKQVNKEGADSTKIVKPKPEPAAKQKPITGPISGPIGDGPSSYDVNVNKNKQKVVTKKTKDKVIPKKVTKK